MTVKAIPEGYHTITPYLPVKAADRFIEFLKEAFGAEEIACTRVPGGPILNAELRIGTSMLMTSEARSPESIRPTAMYLYVENVDAFHDRAVKAGGKSLMPPMDMFYGDRSGGVEDPFGNQWWLATRIEDVSPEEVLQRASQQGR